MVDSSFVGSMDGWEWDVFSIWIDSNNSSAVVQLMVALQWLLRGGQNIAHSVDCRKPLNLLRVCVF